MILMLCVNNILLFIKIFSFNNLIISFMLFFYIKILKKTIKESSLNKDDNSDINCISFS